MSRCPKENLGLFPPRASNEQGGAALSQSALSQSASALLQACPGTGDTGRNEVLRTKVYPVKRQ